MAYAQSVQKAQMILHCQLCEENSKIQWKCITCDFLICLKCMKIHEKVKSAEKHCIISLKDIASYNLNATETTHSEHKFKVIGQYKTNFPNISKILCCTDGSLWIYCLKSQTCLKLTVTGESINILRTIYIDASDMALNSNGEIISCSRTPNLKRIDVSDNVRNSKFCVQPMIPFAVHVTRNDKIVVGVLEHVQPFPIQGHRKIIQMDKKGKREIFHYLDKENNKPLFTLPWRISSDIYNNLYVIDKISPDYRGRVMKLRGTGGVIGLYEGNTDLNTPDKAFKPQDLVVTPSGNVIVTDMENSLLHVLNDELKCIRCFNTRSELHISYPASLSINSYGQLLIGCSTDKQEKEEAKIYAVEYSAMM